MSEFISRPQRNHSPPWPQPCEQFRRRRGKASIVGFLEEVGVRIISGGFVVFVGTAGFALGDNTWADLANHRLTADQLDNALDVVGLRK